MTTTAALPFKTGVIHFIGIGGIGMSGIAEVLHHLGYQVQGSDQSDSANVQRLQKQGIRVMIGHNANNVLTENGSPCAVIVRSSAVKENNVEIQAARAAHIPVTHRADMLAELLRLKWAISVAGTHGKTTTSSLIGHVMEKAGLDPTVINGGIINAYGTNTRMGQSNWMVVEADESDGTFTKLPSVCGTITNIDPEHMEHYGSFDKVKAAFVRFVENMPFYGFVVACIDHPVVAELVPTLPRRVISYGTTEQADICATNIRTTPDGLMFDILFSEQFENWPKNIKDVRLPMFGAHNVLNSLTCFAIGHETGLSVESVVTALSSFAGVKRRFTTTGIVNDITVIDDYGHHPVEIKSVLQAGREAVEGKGSGRVIAVMQPHRYSRLHDLFDDFCQCFDLADHVVIANVYAAGEDPIDGASQDALVAGIQKTGHKNVTALSSETELAPLIADIAKPGDYVICLGAGSITHWANALPAQLKKIFGTADKTVGQQS